MFKKLLTVFLLFLFINGVFSYTAPTFEGQPIIVESSSDFYGSSTGQVTIDLNLTAITTNFKDFFIKIKGLDNTSTIVKEISVNKEKTETLSYPVSQPSKTKISQKLLNKTPLKIILEFDANELGLGREFDIQLVDKDGVIIADLDPFLSGFDYRQEWCLNTDGISLSGSVTNDHPIYFDFSGNTDFLTNAESNGNGIKFTDLSNTEYDFYFEGTGINDAWVEVTETFNSSADTCGYVYYGGDSGSNYENQNGTFPSSYLAVYNFTTSLITADKGDNLTQSGSSSKVSNWGIADNVSNSGDGLDGFTFTGYTTGTLKSYIGITSSTNVSRANYQTIFRQNRSGGGDHTIRFKSGNLQYSSGDGDELNYATSNNTKYYFVATDNGSTSQLFVNGVSRDTGTSDTDYTLETTGWLLRHNTTNDYGLDGNLDNFIVLNYIVSSDEVKLIYNSQSNNIVSFSAQETTNNSPEVTISSPTNTQEYFSSIDVNFNVSELDGDNIDLNIYYSDIAGQKDTLIYSDSNLADGVGITCLDYDFTDGSDCFYSWDILNIQDGNWFIDLATSDGTDTNEISSQEFIINQRETIYPREATFSNLGIFTTDSLTYNTVFEFDFNYLFPTTPMFVTCVFDTNSTSVSSIQGDYQIEKSNDGVTYTEVGTASVTMNGLTNFFNSVAITSEDFNSLNNVDSNIYFRLNQKRTGGSGTIKTISMVNPICIVTMANDLNGVNLPKSHKVIDVSTSSTSYVVLDSYILPTANYFYRNLSIGNFSFYQTIAGGTPSLRFCANGLCSAEFLRYVNIGSVGSGSTFGITREFNPAQSVDLNIELKTTAGTGQVTSELHNIAGGFEVGEARGLGFDGNTFSNTDYEPIAVLDFNNKGDIGSFVGSLNIPFSCSASNCLLETFLRVQGSGYDENSLVRKRTSNTTIGQIGFLNSIYNFENVPVQDDLNITMYAKTSTGTITLESGGIAISNFTEVGTNGRLSPSINNIGDWTNLIISDSFDYNLRITDPDGNCLNGSVDLNLFRSSDDGLEKSFNPTLVLNGSFCDANYTFNPLSVADNNYYWTYAFTDEQGLTVNGDGIDNVFIVDNNAPVFSISSPIDSNNNKAIPIDVEFIITDPSFNDFNIDLNYSIVNTQGSGTEVLIDELISSSIYIICSGSYVTGSTCNYSLDMSAVADGNYFVLLEVTANNKTSFLASQEFQIYEGVAPTPTSDINYSKRYINPNYEQRDENIYFNSNQSLVLTDSEKQNIYLQQVTLILLGIGAVIIIIGVILWRKK